MLVSSVFALIRFSLSVNSLELQDFCDVSVFQYTAWMPCEHAVTSEVVNTNRKR